ncbi:protein kinase domain-containing protein [Bacillus alkalicellulosilyticus]|uniref:protein kinase domain-containing protein n=1 Tax=Alkalihalobacterium alkalicellulosilyticum TaxID=1912214 RepID=UPI000997B836|nr:protein kinase [Bacillus alkalicellulosilyticus]
MLHIGEVIDNRYEVIKEIGRGGMSVVYLAMDQRLHKFLVIKDIRKRDQSMNKLLLDSLVAEANLLKKLDHAALPKIYDIIDVKGAIYVVMDFIEGESLKEKIKREGVISASLVIDWATQLSDVLDYLHTRKPNPIIYRDMKPDNVMLTPEGKVKLIDFGIAREYKVESSTDTKNLGTELYAAPEQISNKQTDSRSDIYSLGITLYHLVTGKTLNEPPFELKPIRYWDPSLPEGLEHIIEKCTQSQPDLRYQSCEELRYDLVNIKKLTKEYRKKMKKSLTLFLIPFLLFIGFTTTSVVGYTGIKEEQFQDYMNIINQSNRYVLDGNPTQAIELLEYAITNVDRRRAEAYLNMLDIYSSQNEIDTGLAKIQSYMNDGYGRIHRNDEILFKIAMTYFDDKRDYAAALRHFDQINEKNIPDVTYYKTLATMMGSMNIDYSQFSERLLEFKEYNDSLPNSSKRIDNYNTLANIYSSYKGQIEGANTYTIEIVSTAFELLETLGDEQLFFRYELDFEHKLAQAYHSRAINANDQTEAREDYMKAIDHYYQLIELDVANLEDVMVRIGVIYQNMGEYSQAIEQFERTITQYPDSLDAYVRLVNLLLDIEQSKSEGNRNFNRAVQTYKKASRITDASQEETFSRVTRRLTNLNLLER